LGDTIGVLGFESLPIVEVDFALKNFDEPAVLEDPKVLEDFLGFPIGPD
jgi:hypothetical protein